MRRAVIAAALLALTGCAIPINEHRAPPADWPQLEVTVEHKGFVETQELCDWSVAQAILIGPVYGCARITFEDMRCRIYLWLNNVLAHELLHCRGYDHYGSSDLRDYWETWKKENQNVQR